MTDQPIKLHEAENLSRLLLSEEETNAGIALSFLNHNREYIPYVEKELLLLTFWAGSEALRLESSLLVFETYGEDAFEIFKKQFEIIPELDAGMLRQIHADAAERIAAHQEIMEAYRPFAVKKRRYTDLYYNAGRKLHYHLKAYPEFAAKCYEIFYSANPEDADVLFQLGHIYRNMDLQKSIEYYLRCVAIDPENAGAFYNLASIFSKTDLEKSDRYYDLALKAKPDVFFFRVNIAGVKMHRKRFAEAEPIILSLFEDYPDDEGVLDLYSSLLWEYKKDYKAAENVYRSAFSLYPENENLRGNYGEMLMEINRDEEALDCFLEALSEDSSLHRFSTLIVCLALKMNKIEQARPYFLQLKEKYPELKKPDTLTVQQWDDFLAAAALFQ